MKSWSIAVAASLLLNLNVGLAAQPTQEEGLASVLANLLQGELRAQELSASFDLNLLKSGDGESLALTQSQLRCELDQSALQIHRLEDLASPLFTDAATLENPEGVLVAMSSLAPQVSDGPEMLLAKGQTLKWMKAEAAERCGTLPSCKIADWNNLFANTEFKDKAFDPLNDNSMLAFQEKNLAAIDKATQSTLQKNPTAECLASRKPAPPPQDAKYDWSKKSFSGTGLPKGKFVFTYDDGPHPTYTQKIVDFWATSGLSKPTFFELAQNAFRHPEATAVVRQNEMEVGLHSYDHPDLGSLAKATQFSGLGAVDRSFFGALFPKLPTSFVDWQANELDFQILTAFDILSKVLAQVDPLAPPITKFRLPYGSGVGDPKIGERLSQIQVDQFVWNIDSLDWQDKNPQSVLQRIQRQMQQAG